MLIHEQVSSTYPQDKWSYDYIHKSGGYLVIDKERIKEGKRNAREQDIFDKEQSMGRTCASHGYKVVYLSGTNREKGKTYDATLDGEPTEFKSFKGAGAMVKQLSHALQTQGASVVVVRLESDEQKLYDKLIEARRKLKGRILFYKAFNPETLTELMS